MLRGLDGLGTGDRMNFFITYHLSLITYLHVFFPKRGATELGAVLRINTAFPVLVLSEFSVS